MKKYTISLLVAAAFVGLVLISIHQRKHGKSCGHCCHHKQITEHKHEQEEQK